jgi:hypothetical protein
MPDLCTVADVKAFVPGLATTTTHDTMLQQLVTSTSEDFFREINRADFTPADDYTDRKRLGRTRRPSDLPCVISQSEVKLFLRHWPVNDITSVKVDGVTIAESSDGFVDGWVFEDDLDPEDRDYVTIIGEFTGIEKIEVQYNAGYAETPNDVLQAVVEWVAFRFEGRKSIGQSTKQTPEAGHIQYDKKAMPETTQACVDFYRRNRASLA